MNYTEKYQLPQWEKSDRIMMEDFNDMAEKMEAGLIELNETIAGVGYVIGKYTGNNAYPRTISLGFQPTAVIIVTNMGYTSVGSSVYGGLFGKNCPLNGYAEIASSGFKLNKAYMNSSDIVYYYIAFK